jgi:hypothetical protein
VPSLGGITQQGFQADTMLIHGPDFDLGLREGGRHLGGQRQETLSCVDRLSWLAITVMVPAAVFLFLALTWTAALCPASSVPCTGETVSVGGGCACQVREELPRFLTVSVAVAPESTQVSASFGVDPAGAVAPGGGEEAGDPVADAVAVRDLASAVSETEGEDAESTWSGVCDRCDKVSTATTTARSRPAAASQRPALGQRRSNGTR